MHLAFITALRDKSSSVFMVIRKYYTIMNALVFGMTSRRHKLASPISASRSAGKIIIYYYLFIHKDDSFLFL